MLDLTACTSVTGSYTLSGGVSPTGNDFNRIKGNYVVGLILPSDVTTLSTYAFRDWTELRYITIPAAVTAIVSNTTFYNCTGLTRITFLGSSFTSMKSGTFAETIGKDQLRTLYNAEATKAGTYVRNGEVWSKLG